MFVRSSNCKFIKNVSNFVYRNYTIVFNNTKCLPYTKDPLGNIITQSKDETLKECNEGDIRVDVLVVGGGHAGTEAAAASARMGATTALITHTFKTIGEMSCNPSFGGVGKGHLMREVDALDGVCARACDEAGIHYRMLNKRRGPAVWGPRAQIDRKLYKKFIQHEISHTHNLMCIEASVEDILIGHHPSLGSFCQGVLLEDGQKIFSKAVIITTGTFLKAQILLGQESWPAGRLNCNSSVPLANSLERLGVRLNRLKTGTPPRLLRKCVDFSKLLVSQPDNPPAPFSYLNKRVAIEPSNQLNCHLTHTIPSTLNHLITDNIHNNLMVTKGTTGPRYCPSIESKVLKFPHLSHQVWIEPEGLDSDEVYPQGLSCTMPREVQLQIIRSIPGLERAEISVHGYGVEYEVVDAVLLKRTLELKILPRLFLAGQITGTTGYEEAAAQGILAGINAALKPGEEFVLSREESYIGVMVDDLTSQGVTEPYRMLTSRAEYRIRLRQDNADLRLTEKGYQVGCVSEERYNKMDEVKRKLQIARKKMQMDVKTIQQWRKEIWNVSVSNVSKKSLFSLFSGHLSVEEILEAYPEEYGEVLDDKDISTRLKFQALYSKAERKQDEGVEELKKMDSWRLPLDIDYHKINLSMEAREKLDRIRPETIGAASRIEGVTAASLVNLYRFANKA